MQVIFSRHGNTFSPGEKPVWVGARQDLPLVKSGIQQAKNFATIIRKLGLVFNAIYCGPLKRTREYAEIIIDEIHASLKPIIDSRLNEIDYGDWSSLSSVEIQKKGDAAKLAAWENFSQWPRNVNWSGSENKMIEEIKSFAGELKETYSATDKILVITSNGRLRYFLQLIPNAFEAHIQNKNFKVATGNLCLLIYDDKQWKVEFWNKKPEQLL